MTQAFRQLLDLLANESQPLKPEDVAGLSDLDADQTQDFSRSWVNLSDGRRLDILQESRKLADAQIELTFEAINRYALSDPAPEIRRVAIENLWESEDAALITPLLNALKDDDDAEVRGSAGSALGQFIYLGEMAKLRPETLNAIEDALLTAAHHDQNDRVRRRSLESLGYSSRTEVSELIVSAYQSGDEASMRTALRAMGRSADDIWAPNVLAQLHHPAPSIRLEAVQAAGELSMREAVGEILDLLEDVKDDSFGCDLVPGADWGADRLRSA